MTTMNITIPAVLPPTKDGTALFEALLTIGWLVASTAVCLRVAFRIRLKNKLWLDDWLIIVAEIITTVAFLVCMIVLARCIGQHVYYVNQEELPAFFKAYFFAELTYSLVIGLVKLSILAFYWRIFSTTFWIRIFVMCLAIVVFTWMTCLTFVVIFQCHPIEGTWNPLLPGRICLSYQKFYLGSAIPNISTDFVMVAMPIPYVVRLQMPTDQRAGLIGTFIVGGFVIIVSVIRIVTILKQDYTSVDFTWNMFPVVIWTGVEMLTAIICACLPSMKPVLNFVRTRQFFPARASTDDQGRASHRKSNLALSNSRKRRRPYIILSWMPARTEISSDREGRTTEIIDVAKCEQGNTNEH